MNDPWLSLHLLFIMQCKDNRILISIVSLDSWNEGSIWSPHFWPGEDPGHLLMMVQIALL